jgi:hypothetical protein
MVIFCYSLPIKFILSLGGFITKEMSEATHIVLSDNNSFLTNYTRKHRQYIVHVQVCRNRLNTKNWN